MPVSLTEGTWESLRSWVVGTGAAITMGLFGLGLDKEEVRLINIWEYHSMSASDV